MTTEMILGGLAGLGFVAFLQAKHIALKVLARLDHISTQLEDQRKHMAGVQHATQTTAESSDFLKRVFDPTRPSNQLAEIARLMTK